MPNRSHHEINRVSWNAATIAHNSHKGDQATFFRAGGNTLFPEETDLLGNIAGKALLHLQCNCGQDSLSIANHLGASVTGVDISDQAIDFARQLARDSGIEASYVRADIYHYLETNPMSYDIVYCSYGVLVWLSDLESWGQGIYRCLKDCGRFVMIDFHPAFDMFGESWNLCHDYMGGSFETFESGIGDYVALTGSTGETDQLEAGIGNFVNPHPGIEYQWGVSEVIMALVGAGLSLSDLREYNHCNGFKPIADMSDLGSRRYGMGEGMPRRFPFMFSVVATKK